MSDAALRARAPCRWVAIAVALLTMCGTVSGAWAATPTSAYRSDVIASGPASYWRLGETSGTTAADELGANPGTYSNATLGQPGSVACDANTSVAFSGSPGSYATVPASASLNMTSAVTVEFWAKRRVIGASFQVLVGKPGDGQSQNENYAVWLTSSGHYSAYFGNGSTYVAVQTPAVTDTNWHYVAATDDGSQVKIYLDGVLRQSATTTLKLTANSKPLNFARSNSNTYFFNGWLDEAAVYPSALGATTVQAHYVKGNTDLVPPCLSESAPANGSLSTTGSVSFAGTAGTAVSDSTNVTVAIYSGSSATGTPAQTLPTVAQAGGTWSVSASLPNGTWTAQAQQSNSAGFVGYTAATTFTVQIGQSIPAPTFTSTPPATDTNPNPSIAFTDTASGVTYQCSLDGSPQTPCTSPQSLSGLTDGGHSFQVQAADSAGNLSPLATYSWTIVPPAPAITSSPPNPDSSTNPSFSFTGGSNAVSFMCSLDSAAYVACSSPQSYSGLAGGSHTFQVEAVDAGANTSAPTSYTWAILPPSPTITSTPPDPSNSASPSFSFTDSAGGVTFQCSLDGAAYTACSSPQSYSGVADGSHAFEVVAVDSAGNAGPPATYTWTIDTTPPNVTLTSPANGDTRAEWPTFQGTGGTGSGDASSVTVNLYSGTLPSGTPLQSLTATVGSGGSYAVTAASPLGPGTYTATAQQTDSVSNVGSSTANTFTVGDPSILSAGDIAFCNPNSTPDASRTAKLLSTSPDSLVMPLGDNAYSNGQPSEYQNCYDPTWGVAKARTRPVVGEHDEGTVPGGPPAGTGYVNYFANQLAGLGASASDPTKLYYSYNLGSWHIVVLNDNCLAGLTPGCDEQAQEQWLKSDLSAHSGQCQLVAFHRPRWSSDSVHGNTRSLTAYWAIMYQFGVDVVLNASAHDYERFAPQDADGVADPTYGVREFVVGTGGNDTYSEGTVNPNSQVYASNSYGVLKLTLHPSGYDYQFVPVADGGYNGGSFTDSGTASCHPVPPILPYRDAVLLGSPASYWRFGETSGTTAADEMGMNPGTYSNVILGQPSALAYDANPSALFNGTTSSITVPDSPSLDMSSAVTMELWAKRQAIGSTYQVLVGKPGNGNSQLQNYALWLTPSNKYTAYFGNGTTYAAVQTPAVTDTNWHYLVATYDGAAAKIYLDGVLKQSVVSAVALTPNTSPLSIGRANVNNKYYFNGWLDDLSIYPTALSSTTIFGHYTDATTAPTG